MNHFPGILLIFISLTILNCNTSEKKTEIKPAGESNFYITIYDSDIDNPENDKRCYYMIYIDKVESGRTITGLESQEKDFDVQLTPNRHLIKVEKWILNESMGRYIKLNNIDQPKPDYIYVNIEKNRTVRVTLKSSKTGTASYSMTIE
jgi:hypothetical protein